MPSSRIIKLASLSSAITIRGAHLETGAVPSDPEPVVSAEAELQQLRDALLAQAQAEAAHLRQDAVAGGFEEGLAQAQRASEANVQRLRTVVERVVVDQAQCARATEASLVELALTIARHVVQAELRTNRGLVVTAVQHGLQALEHQASAVVRAHPSEAAYLRQECPDLFGDLAAGHITLVPDERIETGGCVIEAGAARIDCQKRTVLAAVEQAFAEHWGEPV